METDLLYPEERKVIVLNYRGEDSIQGEDFLINPSSIKGQITCLPDSPYASLTQYQVKYIFKAIKKCFILHGRWWVKNMKVSIILIISQE